MGKIKPLFRKYKLNNYNWTIRFFKNTYDKNNYYTAVFLQLGHKGYWVFRNIDEYTNWPSCSG